MCRTTRASALGHSPPLHESPGGAAQGRGHVRAVPAVNLGTRGVGGTRKGSEQVNLFLPRPLARCSHVTRSAWSSTACWPRRTSQMQSAKAGQECVVKVFSGSDRHGPTSFRMLKPPFCYTVVPQTSSCDRLRSFEPQRLVAETVRKAVHRSKEARLNARKTFAPDGSVRT